MATRIQFIIFVIFAYIVCNTDAQELIGKYLANLKTNMEMLNKEKAGKYEPEYVDDDYYDYEDDPPPLPSTSSPPKGAGRTKPSKQPESYAKGSKKDEAPRPPSTKSPPARPPVDKAVGQKGGSGPDGGETLNVLTVKKFMFQAQPVVPAGKRNTELTKIYYYLE